MSDFKQVYILALLNIQTHFDWFAFPKSAQGQQKLVPLLLGIQDAIYYVPLVFLNSSVFERTQRLNQSYESRGLWVPLTISEEILNNFGSDLVLKDDVVFVN